MARTSNSVTDSSASLSTSDVAYEMIRQKIIEGEYAPSQRLVEAQLAQALGLGRHNVRTALDRLQSTGLVTIEPNRGATVATLSLQAALDILVAREALEVAVTRLGAERVSDQQIADLGELVEAMRTALTEGEFDLYSATNKRFHGVIYQASGNRTIPELIAVLRLRMARLQLRTILIPGRSVKSIAEHEAIYAGVAAREPASAGTAAGEHMRSLRGAVEKAWSLVKL